MSDLRTPWDNSPELRDGVREVLRHWGDGNRGGLPHLGYPRQSNIAPPSTPPTPRYDPELVAWVDNTLEVWDALTRHDVYAHALRVSRTELLVLRFVRRMTIRALAKRLRVSPRTVDRQLDDASFRVWAIGAALDVGGFQDRGVVV